MLQELCPWYVAGPLAGMLIVALRAAINQPFGALGGYVDLSQNIWSLQRLGPRGWLLAGLVLGGVAYALASGGLAPGLDYAVPGNLAAGSAAFTALLLLGAGLVMGFGARAAGGCTSGHGMSGMAAGSPASLAATATFFGAAVVLAHVWSWIGGAP